MLLIIPELDKLIGQDRYIFLWKELQKIEHKGNFKNMSAGFFKIYSLD